MSSVREQIREIDFCDGQIERAELANGEVVVVFKNWQGRIFQLRFRGVVYFRSYEFGGDVSEVQIEEDTEEIRDAVRVMEQDGRSGEADTKLVQVTLMSEIPMMTIVCLRLENDR